MERDDKDKNIDTTVFVTCYGPFKYKGKYSGLIKALVSFQRVVDFVLILLKR